MKNLLVRLESYPEISEKIEAFMADKDWSSQKAGAYILRSFFSTEPKEANNPEPKQKKQALIWDEVFSTENQKEIKNLRKLAKAPITQRALDGISKQIKMAIAGGFTMDQILDTWTDKGWKSFKADWMKNQATPQNYVMTTQAQTASQKTMSSSQGNVILSGLRA